MKRTKALAAARSIVGRIVGSIGRSGRSAAKAGVSAGLTLGIGVAILFALAGNGEAQGVNFCSQTASTLFSACQAEVKDDSLVKRAICINLSEAEDRNECFGELETERQEGTQLCREQRDGRLDVCALLGEERYDPEFEAEDFDADFRNLTNPNPYFPLTIGNRWEYRGGTESITIEVLNRTKLIDEVTCVVVRDLVKDEGRKVEDTDDWFGQDEDGNVWYCGEEVKDFETFEGDRPMREELVSIDGSFKAGRDGDAPGIQFLASPAPGDVYRQEFSLGNAEDIAEILSTTYSFGNDPELDRFVPQRLAERLCSGGDCVVINEFAPIEPGVSGRKYYAPGIGFFLDVKPDTGEVARLVNCNFDNRCRNLPQP